MRSDAELQGYAHCTSVEGDLRIEHAGVTDLAALAGLRRVSGTLSIVATAELEDLRGLEQLTRVGTLEITDNEGLRHTAGLVGLQQVGRLVVARNPKLISLAGLKALQRAQSVDVSKNRLLAGYFGLLPGLTRVDSQLVLRQNPGLSKREVAEVMQRIPQGHGTLSATSFHTTSAE